MRPQLGSFKTQQGNLNWSALNVAGGNLTAASRNLYLSLRNRVGRSLLSPAKSVTYLAGEQIEVTIDSSVAQDGEDGWQVIISGETTGNQADAVQLATFDLKDLLDRETLNTLPATINFTEDFHLETDNLVVATFGDLPTGAIAGTVREVADEGGQIYVWNEDLTSWVFYQPTSYFTDIANTRNAGGSDQLLGADLLISPLPFDAEVSSVTSETVRYWLLNDAPEGGGPNLIDAINLRISINGATVSDNGVFWGGVFSELIKFELIGYYRLLTASLDTGVVGVGVAQFWNAATNQLSLVDPLPAGYAAVYDIWLEADISVLLQAGYSAGDVLSIGFDYIGKIGRPEPVLASLIGENVIFGEGDRLKVFPNKLLRGSAMISGFYLQNTEETPNIFNSAPANTANQSVIIKGSTGGTVRTSTSPVTLAGDEQVLAVFSTQEGFTNPGAFSDVVTLASASGLRVTVQHPVSLNLQGIVREDYPDITIRGQALIDWQNPPFRVYLLQGSTLWEKQTLEISDSAQTQIIDIIDLSDYVDITATPPQNAELLFGDRYSLIAPGQPTLQDLGSGVLTANSYQVAIRYEYSSPNNIITSLSQDIEGTTVKRFPQSFEDLLSTFQLWKDNILTRATARDLDFDLRTPNSIWLFSDLGYTPYRLDRTLVTADDGRNAIRFNVGAGGFVPLRTMLRTRDRTSTLLPAYTTYTFGLGLNAVPNTVESAINITLDQDALTVPQSRSNLLTSSGSFLIGSSNNLLVGP